MDRRRTFVETFQTVHLSLLATRVKAKRLQHHKPILGKLIFYIFYLVKHPNLPQRTYLSSETMLILMGQIRYAKSCKARSYS